MATQRQRTVAHETRRPLADVQPRQRVRFVMKDGTVSLSAPAVPQARAGRAR